ncbi:beta-fructofuranosidase, insoluble isoenzyme CWINV1-like [Macadamia integrifolia]|uniref:beta-fructofuranosidase, insoluble isoenzyme CWINV1-like n=1 Tax=Macadamia integrifolia TaxID=60698 RepID=UPI001C4ED447|nr:beta-fructofuranosidase, insoluble isoenzyme CWINV1-like [Macadamia integrifolia]
MPITKFLSSFHLISPSLLLSSKEAMAFTAFWFIGLCSLLLGYGVHVEASHKVFLNLQSHQNATTTTHQPYRTGYHFQPAKNWINDPDGPMIYKGIYHLFYQYNPKGAVWGNIVWAHSTSTDLVNWVHHEPAIKPSIKSDINGCWSGSTTILPGYKPAILYTGIDPQNRQVQNLAFPKNLSDPFLVEWTKPPQNPVMTPIDGINASSFRDPTTAWKAPDGKWRVIIGSKIDRLGKAILYKSKDFIKWERVDHPLHSSKNTGMWECPDFFPVSVNSGVGLDTSVTGPSVKHVLKVSLDDTKHEYYTIGTYNLKKDKYFPNKGSIDNGSGLRYDYGKFYASKTFFDSSKNRRILWGWINESDSVNDDIKKGWSGVQAIPRNIWLDKSGKQLVQWPIDEIEKLHEKPVDLQSTELKKGSVIEVSGITASQADVEVSFDLSTLKNAEKVNPSWDNPQLLCSQKGASVKGSLGPFGLLVLASEGLEEQTAVFFRVFKNQKRYVVLMCSDQSRSSLRKDLDKTTYGAFLDVDPLHEQLSLRSLIDHSIVESFGGKGKVCITSRVYPKNAVYDKAHLYVFNNGTEDIRISKLSAWSMKKAEISY